MINVYFVYELFRKANYLHVDINHQLHCLILRISEPLASIESKIQFFFSVLAVRWNADGNYCLSCGKDSTIKLWNPFKSMCVALFSGHGRDVTDVDCAGDSEHFVSR